jgi:hypothetical protein
VSSSAYAATPKRFNPHPYQTGSKAFTDGTVDLLPSAVDTPLSEIVVDGRPSREVVGKQAPLATALQDVKDGVQDLTKIVDPRPSMACGGGQMRLDVVPFGIGKIRWVMSSHTC